MLRRLLAIVSVLSLWAHDAGAQLSPSKTTQSNHRGQVAILIVGDSSFTRQAQSRIRGELSGAGLGVASRFVNIGANPRPDLEAAVAALDAVAGIAIVQGGQEFAEVWVFDQRTGTTSMLRLDLKADAESHGPSVLAVRCVEFLRANLAVLQMNEPTAPQASKAVARTRGNAIATNREKTRAFATGGGALVLVNLGATGPRIMPHVSIAFAPTSKMYLRWRLAALSQSSLSSSLGEVKVAETFSTLCAGYKLGSWGPIELGVAAGAGLFRLAAVGQSSANDSVLGREQVSWKVAFEAGPDLGLRINDLLQIEVQIHSMSLASPIDVYAGQSRVARSDWRMAYAAGSAVLRW